MESGDIERVLPPIIPAHGRETARERLPARLKIAAFLKNFRKSTHLE